MHTKIKTMNGVEITIVESNELLIKDIQSALDLIGNLTYGTQCRHVLLHKSSICEDFFDLKTRLAGDILQKFITYDVKLAIVGDFSIYSSQSLKDFIYESNNGNHIFFLSSEEEALQKLALAR